MKKESFERPEAGPFYLIPDPKSKKYTLMSEFEKPGNEQVHLFLWDKVVEVLRRRFKKEAGDTYRGLPRGRVINNNDNNWIVTHGNDFPLSEYKDDIISEFKLRDAVNLGKVKWEYTSHETMSKEDKEDVERVLGIKINAKGFISR